MHAHITCTPIKAWILVQMKVPAKRPGIRRKVTNSNFYEILQILKALLFDATLHFCSTVEKQQQLFSCLLAQQPPLSPFCRSAKTLRGCLLLLKYSESLYDSRSKASNWSSQMLLCTDRIKKYRNIPLVLFLIFNINWGLFRNHSMTTDIVCTSIYYGSY